MSVSLALLPVALALRVVMGKDGFENWVASVQLKVPTSISDESELVASVRKANYDCLSFLGGFKTHFKHGTEFLTWEQINGQWTAVFSTFDDRAEVLRFMDEVEREAGKKIFDRDALTSPLYNVSTRSYPTNFSDANLLKDVLAQHGAISQISEDGVLVAQFGSDLALRFRPNDAGVLSVEIPQSFDERMAHNLMARLDDSYREQIQEVTYNGLIARLENSHLSIESQEVLPDKTIVITLNVPG